MERAIRRVARLYDFFLNENNEIKRARWAIRAKKKRVYGPKEKKLKFGIEVPRTVKDAFKLDQKNGNTLWQDALEKEMKALEELDCFEYHPAGYNPGDDFQRTRLHIVFDIKSDTLCGKVRLVAGGHLIDVLGHEVYSSTVKGISVKLLHVIAHAQKLDVLTGDIGNAFVTAYIQEKKYCIAGPEFGARRGLTIVIKKALHGLATSAARFHSHLADTLRTFGFTPTRYDNDVWIRRSNDKSYYEYVCTHVDYFSIFSREPQKVMDQIQSVYTVKTTGPPE